MCIVSHQSSTAPYTPKNSLDALSVSSSRSPDRDAFKAAASQSGHYDSQRPLSSALDIDILTRKLTADGALVDWTP